MNYPTWITPILSGYLIGSGTGRLLVSHEVVPAAILGICLGIIGLTLHFNHLSQMATRRRCLMKQLTRHDVNKEGE